MAFVEINGIKKHFGAGDNKIEVLKGIDLEIEKGEMCVLLGPSGSGKSTLLNIIGAIESADEGTITVNGEKTRLMNEKQLTRYRRKHLGYVFQMYNLIPNLTVRENIEVGAYLSDNPLDIDELMAILGRSNLWQNAATGSFPAVNSRGLQSAGRLLKIQTFCFAMNQRVHLITKPQRKF